MDGVAWAVTLEGLRPERKCTSSASTYTETEGQVLGPKHRICLKGSEALELEAWPFPAPPLTTKKGIPSPAL